MSMALKRLRPLTIFFCFQLAVVLFQHLFVSLGAFFHFQLGHPLSVIDDWANANAIFLVLFSKLIPLCFFLYMLKKENNPINSLLLKVRNFVMPDPPVSLIVILTVSWIYLGILCDVSLHSGSFNFPIFFKSFFLMSLIYLVDLFVVVTLIQSGNKKSADSPTTPILYWFVYALIFWIGNRFAYPYMTEFSPTYLLHFIFILYLFERSKHWIWPMFYLFFVIIIFHLLLGILPFNTLVSPLLQIKEPVSFTGYLVMYFVLCYYLEKYALKFKK